MSVLVGVALLAALALIGVTPHGPGVTPDSTIYLESAQNLAAGAGLSARGEAMARYPPTFPLLLAIGGGLTGDTLSGARVSLALLFATNVFLISLTAYRGSGGAAVAGLAGALLFAGSPDVFELHIAALSEPLFICCSLAALLLLARYLSRHRYLLLIGSAVFLALALTTRYAAIPLVLPMFLALWVFGPRSQRIRDMLMLGLIGSTPFVLWLLRNLLVAGTATEREFGYRGSPIPLVRRAIHTLHDFWLPLPIAGGFKLLLLLLLAVALTGWGAVALRAWRGAGKEMRESRALLMMWAVFACLYLSFVFATVTFLDAHTPVDRRILAPFSSAILILGAALGGIASRVVSSGVAKWALAGMLLLVVSVRAGRLISLSERVRSEGYGYTAPAWKSSPTVAYVRSLPPGLRVYSNGPDALRFLTGRSANPVPRKFNPATGRLNTGFDQEVIPLCGAIESRTAVLVYLERIRWRTYLPTHPELAERCGLTVSRSFRDGVIYGE